MKIRNIWFVITTLLSFTGCEDNEIVKSIDSYQYHSDSFFPMAIGNYWRANDQNYTEITNAILIQGVLYYEVHSIIGGDVSLTEYLRIDNENNLIMSYPNASSNYVRAKFNSSIGDTFFTLNDSSWNDLKVTTISKSEDTMEFEYQMVYHPNLSASKSSMIYKKGLGPVAKWREVRIDGTIYKYD
jgi:hypothetical protein